MSQKNAFRPNSFCMVECRKRLEINYNPKMSYILAMFGSDWSFPSVGGDLKLGSDTIIGKLVGPDFSL